MTTTMVVAVSVPCRQVQNEEFGFVPIGTVSYFRREMERERVRIGMFDMHI